MNVKRNMRWLLSLLIFCGVAAGVLAVGRQNFLLAVLLMVFVNSAVIVRLRGYQRRLESLRLREEGI